MSLAPWFPPDFGLRKTNKGDTLLSGIGFMQKNSLIFFDGSFFSSTFLFECSCTVARGGILMICPFLPLSGHAFKLFLKFPLGGTLTIQVGGTIL